MVPPAVRGQKVKLLSVTAEPRSNSIHGGLLSHADVRSMLPTPVTHAESEVPSEQVPIKPFVSEAALLQQRLSLLFDDDRVTTAVDATSALLLAMKDTSYSASGPVIVAAVCFLTRT